MSSIQNRIQTFSELGNFLSQFSRNRVQKKDQILNNELFFDGFQHQMKLAQENNTWFTKENILFALESWSEALTQENLNTWISNEELQLDNQQNIPKICRVKPPGI